MYSSKPRSRRLLKVLTLGVVGAAIGAPGAQAEEFVPGVTDFPSRVETKANFVAGVTDFPSRLGAKAEQAARMRIARDAPSPSASQPIANSDVDWGAVVIGVALGAGGVLLAAAVLRTRLRPRLVRA